MAPTRSEWKAMRPRQFGEGEGRAGYLWALQQMAADPGRFLQEIVEPPADRSEQTEHSVGALRAAIEVVDDPTIRHHLEGLANAARAALGAD